MCNKFALTCTSLTVQKRDGVQNFNRGHVTQAASNIMFMGDALSEKCTLLRVSCARVRGSPINEKIFLKSWMMMMMIHTSLSQMFYPTPCDAKLKSGSATCSIPLLQCRTSIANMPNFN